MIKRLLNLLLCIVCSPALAAGDEFFGLNALSFFHYRDDPAAPATAGRRMNDLKRSGAGMDRFDLWWGVIEPAQGQFDWKHADWLIDFYHRNGVGMLPILCYRASWMTTPPLTDAERAQYAEFVRQCVSRYKDKVRCWEIWNEPNIPTFWDPPNAKAYAELLKVAYAAAKQADPTCIVVGASASEPDCNWLLDICAHGAASAMDAVSFHPYSMADGPEQMHFGRQIDNVRRVMRQAGRPDIPLWITEMGWMADDQKPEELSRQSRYLVQSHVIALAHGVEKLFWFNLQDWREKDHLEGWGLTNPQGKPKPSLKVYCQMIDRLSGERFLGWHPIPGGKAAIFTRNSAAQAVVWADMGKTVDGRRLSDSAPVVIESDPVYVDLDAAPAVVQRLPEPENLLVNGDLALQRDQKTFGWRRGVFYGGETAGTFLELSAPAPALGLSQTTSALWQSFPIPALPGETYRLRGQIKTDNATGDNGLQILFLSGPGWGWKGGPQSQTIIGSHDWQTVELTGTVPADANVLRINLVSKNNQGAVYFKDLHVQRLGD